MKIITTKDVEAIRSLWQSLNTFHGERSLHFKEEFDKKTFEQRFKDLASGDTYQIFIALEGDQALGYILASLDQDKIGEIDSLYVKQEARGKKVGQVLMNKAMDYLKNQDAGEIHLKVAGGNETAFDFYDKMGFYVKSHHLVYRPKGGPR